MPNYRKTFSDIYDKHVNKIYRFVYLKVNSQEVAEDLTSETFTKGWQAVKRGKKIENHQAFLFRIARNLVVDYYREKGKMQIVSTDEWDVVDPNINLEAEAILASDIGMIKQALTNIHDDYQTVLIWRYLDEISIQEVSKMMDKSEEATRVTIHRALKSLKNELDKHQNPTLI